MKRNGSARTVMPLFSVLLVVFLVAGTTHRAGRASSPAVLQDSTTGEIKGTLVAQGSKRPLSIVPDLLRDKMEGENEEEIQRLMNQMETVPDSTCGFHWVNVPPGHYHLFTYDIGLIRPGFDVVAGEVIDLGDVEVEVK